MSCSEKFEVKVLGVEELLDGLSSSSEEDQERALTGIYGPMDSFLLEEELRKIANSHSNLELRIYANNALCRVNNEHCLESRQNINSLIELLLSDIENGTLEKSWENHWPIVLGIEKLVEMNEDGNIIAEKIIKGLSCRNIDLSIYLVGFIGNASKSRQSFLPEKLCDRIKNLEECENSILEGMIPELMEASCR